MIDFIHCDNIAKEGIPNIEGSTTPVLAVYVVPITSCFDRNFVIHNHAVTKLGSGHFGDIEICIVKPNKL